MGFIDYAWSVSLQKDNTKVKILQDPSLDQPVLQSDEIGYTIKLPLFRILEDGNVSFLGHQFKGTNEGITKVSFALRPV